MSRRIILLLLICSLSDVDAFSAGGEKNHIARRLREGVKNVDDWSLVPSFMIILLLWQPLETASAAPFNEFPILPNPSSSAKVVPNISDTNAFKLLPRERQPPLAGAVKEIKDLQELQDSRLDACVEKGKFWEQCFMYGQSDVKVETADGRYKGRMDKQLISPMGALDPPSDTQNKIPTW